MQVMRAKRTGQDPRAMVTRELRALQVKRRIKAEARKKKATSRRAQVR